MRNNATKIYDSITFYISVAFYLCLFIFLTSGYTGNKAIPLRNNNKLFLETVMPESWLFFSKSPIDIIRDLYLIQDNKLVYVDQRPFTPTYYFGINRSNRIIGFEIKNILDELPPGRLSYITGASTDLNLINADTLHYNDLHSANTHLIKGKVVIALRQFRFWPQEKTKAIRHDSVILIPVNILPL